METEPSMIDADVENPQAIQEDTRLIHNCQRNPAAFSVLYRKYLGPVYRYHYARTGQAADAEDLTSQTFLAALEALPRYHDQGAFAAWLFAIARRKVADHYRLAVDAPLDELAEPLLHLDSHSSDPAGHLLEAEEHRRLAKQLAALDEDERELLRLRFAALLPFEQIAELLGRKPSAVKMTVYRLLERLERQMEADHA